MPYECSLVLKQNREEEMDQHEKDAAHLKSAENAYKEVAEIYNFDIINCGEGNTPRTIEDIHNDVIKVLKKHI